MIRRIEETVAYAHYKARVECADNGALRDELKQWIDTDYRVFCFDYIDKTYTAFWRQCALWHEMDGPANKLDKEGHPIPNVEGAIPCPICSNTTDKPTST